MGHFEESQGTVLVFFRGANAWIDALGFKKCLIKGCELKTLCTVFLGGNVTTVVHESELLGSTRSLTLLGSIVAAMD